MYGFELDDGGEAYTWEDPRTRRIEWIGDSQSSGASTLYRLVSGTSCSGNDGLFGSTSSYYSFPYVQVCVTFLSFPLTRLRVLLFACHCQGILLPDVAGGLQVHSVGRHGLDH